MNRRGLILSVAGAGLAVSGLAAPRGLAAAAATDDELTYASFGQAAEFLLKDFYARAVAAKLFDAAAAGEFARGGASAGLHADALGKLLAAAGQTAAVEEDFEFVWPAATFSKKAKLTGAGLTVARPLLGVYQMAAASISIPTYRTLYASMAANLSQQVGALSQLSGGRIGGISFPPAVDVQTASDAIEAYLG